MPRGYFRRYYPAYGPEAVMRTFEDVFLAEGSRKATATTTYRAPFRKQEPTMIATSSAMLLREDAEGGV